MKGNGLEIAENFEMIFLEFSEINFGQIEIFSVLT